MKFLFVCILDDDFKYLKKKKALSQVRSAIKNVLYSFGLFLCHFKKYFFPYCFCLKGLELTQ